MFRIKLSMLLICVSVACFGQTTTTDTFILSLKQLPDTTQWRLLIDQAMLSPHTKDKNLEYVLTALSISQKINDPWKQAETKRSLAMMYADRNQFDKASLLIRESLEEFRLLSDEKKVATVLFRLGNIERSLNKEMEAITNYLEAISIFEKYDDKKSLAQCYNNMGNSYRSLGNSDLGLQYLLHSLTIKQEIGEPDNSIANTLNNIALIYQNKKMYAKSLEYVEKCILYRRKAKNPIGEANALNIKSDIFVMQKKYSEAQTVINETQNLINKQQRLTAQWVETIHLQSQVYEGFGRFQEALTSYKLFKELSDSLQKSKITTDTDLIRAQFEFSAKEKENERLKMELELADERRIRLFIIFGVLFLTVLFIIYLYRGKAKLIKFEQNLNKVILEQNAELSKKQKMLQEQSEQVSISNKKLQEQNQSIENVNKELRETIQQLHAAQIHIIQHEKLASIGQLVAGISHELNNPLNFISTAVEPIRFYTESMLEKFDHILTIIEKTDTSIYEIIQKEAQLDPSLKEINSELNVLLEGVKTGAIRAAGIIKNLQTFSKSTSEIDLVDLESSINLTLSILKHTAGDDLQIIRKYSGIPPVKGYSGEFNQIFFNLINNAIQAMEDKKGKIEIKTESSSESVFITIKDTGKGIPQQLLNKIFDPFFTTHDVGKGTGLGLWATYGMITKIHGQIIVSSEEGKGTVVSLQFPLVSELVSVN